MATTARLRPPPQVAGRENRDSGVAGPSLAPLPLPQYLGVGVRFDPYMLWLPFIPRRMLRWGVGRALCSPLVCGGRFRRPCFGCRCGGVACLRLLVRGA